MSSKTPASPFCLASFVFLFDQATKLWAENAALPRTIISGFLTLTPLSNTGLLFGFWHTKYLKILTLILSGLVIYVTGILLRKQNGNRPVLKAGVGLVWGGMAGNLIDRLVFGSVFDFIRLWFIPVFNLADTALTFGACAIAFDLLFCERKVDKVK